MKKFEIHWLDGKVEVLEGNSPKEAFITAGYGNGALKAVDYIKEKKEMNTNSNCYWNLLNNNEKRELVKKVTGLKNAPNEIVLAPVIPGIVETYLETHPDEIKSKYQVYVKNYKGAHWEEYERPTFMLNLAFNWADNQFKEYSAYAVAVLDLFTGKLMAINY